MGDPRLLAPLGRRALAGERCELPGHLVHEGVADADGREGEKVLAHPDHVPDGVELDETSAHGSRLHLAGDLVDYACHR